jgi:hypothetical protein
MTSFITTRRYATSTPRNFHTGFPIFPPGTSAIEPATPIRIGGGSPDQEAFRNPLLNSFFVYGNWRFRGRVTASMFFGHFFGFNMEYNVSGATESDGTGFLSISNDVMEGGLAIGMSFDVNADIRLERSTGRTFSFNTLGDNWIHTWEEVVDQSFSFNIDLLGALVSVVGAIITGSDIPRRLANQVRSVGSVGALYGLFGVSRDQFQTTGRAELRPQFNLSWNVLETVPEARAVLAAFRKVGLRISMGPVFNFVFPIRFQVARVDTNIGVYRVTGTRSIGRDTLLSLGGGPTGSLPPTTGLLGVIHSHTASFEFTMELNVHVSFLGVFRIDETTPVGYNHQQLAVGIPDILGPFFTVLSGPGPTAAALEIPEVEWG